MSLVERKKIMTAPIVELLKPRGFRKSGMNFTAARADAVLFVNLQSSTSITQEALKMTCNLGIQLRQLAQSSPSSIYDAHWQQRIGFFMSEPGDFWWTCATDEAADRAGREIAGLLEHFALPEMERIAVPATMVALWKSGRSPGLTDWRRIEYLAEMGES